MGNHVGEKYRRKLFDIMNERVTQYRRYADLHQHFQKKHLDWVADVSSQNTSLSARLTSINNAINNSIVNSGWVKGTKRYAMNVIQSLVGKRRK